MIVISSHILIVTSFQRSHRSFERNEVFKNDLKQLGKDLERTLYIHLHRSTAIDNIDNIDNTQF